jgi:TorA maturation chaperone TorD
MSVRCAEPAEVRNSEERARLYGFLAGVFGSPPTEESQRALSDMATVLGIDCPRELAVSELEREFMDLFVVPNARYVTPYESAYRDRWLLPPGPGKDATEQAIGGLLMGESTLAVRQYFLDAGVLPSQDLPDHFSNELRLMSHLWSGEAAESRGGHGRLAELRTKLRDDHLLKWLGELRGKVSKQDRLGFYSAALHVVEVVLEDDRN